MESQLHKVDAENESLTFRNDQLVKRVESLQDELETLAHSKGGSVKVAIPVSVVTPFSIYCCYCFFFQKGKFPKKSKDAKELLSELGALGERVLILEEELQNKIQQNAELTSKVRRLFQ